MNRLSFRPRPLDIHKKLPIVKSIKDFEDDEAGSIAAASTRNSQLLRIASETDNEAHQPPVRKNSSEIPTPQYSVVDTYERDYTCTFSQPTSYLRVRGARAEIGEFVEYDLDNEDEDWLEDYNSEKKNLAPEKLEALLFKLEVLDHKTRERAGIVAPTFGSHVPVLLQPDAAAEALQAQQNVRFTVFRDVYEYWKGKRERWQKPILRRLQPPPPVNDTNPYNVFRPREKVHRLHTRRMQRRENNVQSFDKLRQVRRNLEQAKTVLEATIKREEKKREVLECEVNLQRFQIKYKVLKRKKHDALYEALQKLKEELMLLGFISLLLTAVQNLVGKICVHPSVSSFMLPCKIDEGSHKKDMHNNVHRLLSGSAKSNTCAEKGKASLLSLEALHHLHIFIFVLAAVHVGFCAFTMALGSAKIRKWKHWEESIRKEIVDNEHNEHHESVQLEAHCEFVRDRALGIWKGSISWILSFLKQFYASVTKSDYTALRSGFVARHCGANKKFNFYKYMMRTLEDDFKVVVGISWYLWLFAVIFLLLNLEGWHIYFWLSFLPLTLLLFVNTKLEHVITRLAHETLESQEAHVKPSDHHFWFRRPGIILYLIHFILFQNSFELAFVFTIWILYGFHSCIMGQVGYIIPRLVIGVIVQVLCSYSTLPLYAIVTQMGDSFKQAIFADQLQSTLHNWAETARRKKKPGSSTSLVKSLNVFGSKKNEVAMQNVTSETPTISQNDQKPEENDV